MNSRGWEPTGKANIAADPEGVEQCKALYDKTSFNPFRVGRVGVPIP